MGRRFVYFGSGVPSCGKHAFASFDVVALRAGSDEFRRLSITTRQISTPRPRKRLPGFLLAQPQHATDKEGQSHTDFSPTNACTAQQLCEFRPEVNRIGIAATDLYAFVPFLTEFRRISVACFKGNKFLEVMSKVWADACF